jgi:O-antigen ligase
MITVAYAALWVFVFVVPWELLVALPGLSIVSRGTGAIAVGLTMLAIVIHGRVRRWRVFHVAALVFVIWAGVGAWFLNVGGLPKKLYTFVQLFLVLFMMWELGSTPKRVRGLMAAYVFGCCVPAIATIILYLHAGDTLRRFSAGGHDPNDLAMTLALAVPIAWYLALTTRGPLVRWLFRGYLPLGLLATALTGSRGGLLASMVALLVIPLTMRLSAGRLVGAVASLCLCGALVVVYVPTKVMKRLSTTGTEIEDKRFGGRFTLWKAGVHAFVHRPVMGYGVGGFVRSITPELGDRALVAHNSFLSVLVEEGLIGLWLYLTMVVSVYFSIRRLPRIERRFAFIMFATLLTAMMPLTWEDQKAAWLIMGILIGLSGLYYAKPRAATAPLVARRPAPAPSREETVRATVPRTVTGPGGGATS